ncbi:MAG TPA: Trp biosynthesis-associated membrane protein [Microlunatus sp.]
MTRRTTVLAWLAAAGLLALVASAQPWWRAVGDGAESAGATVAFSGSDVTGGLSQALAVVVLAGVLLTLVLAATGRRVVAILLGLTGAAGAVLGALGQQPSEAAVRSRFRQVSLVEQFSLSGTAWPWIYAAAGVLVAAGAVLLWRGAPRWPQRGQRFQRPGEPSIPTAAPTAGPEAQTAMADPSLVWRALDAGQDPTVEPEDDTPAAPIDPQVQVDPHAQRDTATATMDDTRRDSPVEGGKTLRDEQAKPRPEAEPSSGPSTRRRNEER